MPPFPGCLAPLLREGVMFWPRRWRLASHPWYWDTPRYRDQPAFILSQRRNHVAILVRSSYLCRMFSCYIKPVVYQSVYIYTEPLLMSHELMYWLSSASSEDHHGCDQDHQPCPHFIIRWAPGRGVRSRGHWPAEQYTLLIALVLNTTIAAWTWTGE